MKVDEGKDYSDTMSREINQSSERAYTMTVEFQNRNAQRSECTITVHYQKEREVAACGEARETPSSGGAFCRHGWTPQLGIINESGMTRNRRGNGSHSLHKCVHASSGSSI